jgi:hypothetical protein
MKALDERTVQGLKHRYLIMVAHLSRYFHERSEVSLYVHHTPKR